MSERCPTKVLVKRMREHSELRGVALVHLTDRTRRLLVESADELERLQDLLRDVLPHVEKMADILATGPIRGPIEHLADEVRAAAER